ncbi:MAG: glucosaminidase domain-containing protein [Bacteroidota bacterium]
MKGKIALEWIKKYWFRVVVLSFMLFVLLKKDISFGINFNAPKRPQQELQQTGPQPTQQKEKREYFTQEGAASEQQASLMDRLPYLGWGSKKEDTANPEMVNEYLTKFVNTARAESQEFGLPASIILANAMVHSKLGDSELSKNSNNHFNLPCTADWKGTVNWDNKNCFRSYDTALTSFRDHSLFLTTGEHAKLLELGKTDYKAWAKAIEKIGYSSERRLAKQLIKLIETYRLQQLDAN